MTRASGLSSTTRRTIINVVLALIGATLLVLTVRRVGLAEVRVSLTAIGWWYFPILALGGLRFAARARAWQVCAGSPLLSSTRAVSAILGADALGNLTPFGVLASEPSKVYFVHDRVPTVTAVSSVAAENAFYIASVLAMIGAGALAFFSIASVPPALRIAAQVVLVGVLIGGTGALWVMRRQPAILSRLARLTAQWSGRGAAAEDRLREIEVHFYAVLTWPWTRIAHALVCIMLRPAPCCAQQVQLACVRVEAIVTMMVDDEYLVGIPAVMPDRLAHPVDLSDDDRPHSTGVLQTGNGFERARIIAFREHDGSLQRARTCTHAVEKGAHADPYFFCNASSTGGATKSPMLPPSDAISRTSDADRNE